MKKTKAVKPLVDIAMTILLFVLMAYQLTGPFAHEWAGAAMLLAAAVVYGIGARCEDAGRAVAARRLPARRTAAQQPRTGR